MSKFFLLFIPMVMAAATATAAEVEFAPVEGEAERVVIVANSNDPESVELARYYADRRDIPRANIVSLDLPAGEEIDWHQYVERLYSPLVSWLVENDWLEAIEMDLFDEVGRRKLSTAGHRISYLVTCRGVPLKIRQTKELPTDAPNGTPNTLKPHHAAVDSELSLLNVSTPQRDAFLRNPLFGKTDHGLFGDDGVVRVSRLDGPTFPAVRRLVESAIEAEQRGLVGRALVDIGGPHKKGDEWFEDAVKVLEAADWNPQVDRNKNTLGISGRADALAIYLGWYAGGINGPFTIPGYQFAPGAIALHLHSYSAKSLRLKNGGGWTGPLVARGIAGTVGNVYEPYMEFTHHPHMLIAALLAGATWGEAIYFSMPVLSWQGMAVGDPLYRPYTVTSAEQLAAIEDMPLRYASYLALRELSLIPLEEDGPSPEQLREAASANRAFPSIALAWKYAQLKAAAGDQPGAVAQLGMVGFLRRVRPDEIGLLGTIGEQLQAWGDHQTAVKVWSLLFVQDLPDALRLTWLPTAIQAANDAGQFMTKVEWEREQRRLAPKPDPTNSPGN
ncbi:MAG: TIGR03790 family protein [Opitutaceae bacterium]|jgi:uncharacterized protein (TIGR03790 family)|nr:TIGR03790 family protein [Opitutaceae bacterium]